MNAEEIIIAIVRILGSLLVLRWAFVGGLIAILVDFSDLFLMNLLHLGGVRDYQALDKWLDQVYQLAFLAVALRWQGRARTVAVVLYLFRLPGLFVFELTGERWTLLLFPNVFEFWFMFVAYLRHWRPGFTYSPRNLVLALIPLTLLKECQEYVLHGGRWLDNFTAVEAVDAIWDFLTAPFR